MSVSTLQAIDQNDVHGTLDLTVTPPQGSNGRLVLVRFDNGKNVFIDGNAFTEREPGVFLYSGSFDALMKVEESGCVSAQQIVVPILAEQLKISKEKVVTGGVRIHKTVSERTETVNEPILQEQLEIERVAVNRFVTEAPPVRYEDDVMIIPLMEEVLVVEKRLVLREEVHITKRRESIQKPQQIVLRREEATLERINPGTDQAGSAYREPANTAKADDN